MAGINDPIFLNYYVKVDVSILHVSEYVRNYEIILTGCVSSGINTDLLSTVNTFLVSIFFRLLFNRVYAART